MANAPLIVTITGTSGIGKGYLKDHLKKVLGLSEPAVYTTRKRRTGENRPDRIFVSEEEFRAISRQKKLIFPQKIYGDRYGFDKSAFAKGGIITEVYMGIAQRFKQMYPNAIMIALTTTDTDFLRYRLQKRGDDPKLALKRIKASQREIAATIALKNIFDINYNVGFENESRIVQDIQQRLVGLVKQRNSATRKASALKKLNSIVNRKKKKLNRFKKIRRK